MRQQLKWVTRGTILAVVPYTLFYVTPYLLGALPGMGMKLSVLSLGLLPLTFGYAIFRYRLMDVDLIFKRGVVYTLGGGRGCGTCTSHWSPESPKLVHMQKPGTGPAGIDPGGGGHRAPV